MKAYRSFSAARKAANGDAILRVGDLYLVGDLSGITEVAILPAEGPIAGHITLRHLARLGNGNWAEEEKSFTANVQERRARANLH